MNFMRLKIFLIFMIPLLVHAQDSLRVPVLFPGETCSVFPMEPGNIYLKAWGGPSFFPDKPSTTVNLDAELCFNPSKKTRLTYSMDFNRQPSYIYDLTVSGFTFMYDFLKNPDYTLAAGLSIHTINRTLKWENLIFPDQLSIPDTLIQSNEVHPEVENGKVNKLVGTAHAHFVFMTPHLFATARFYDLTTPNLAEISYYSYSGGISVNAGYMNNTQNGFRTIATGWKMNMMNNHVFHIQALYQFHFAGLGLKMSTNKTADTLLMLFAKKYSLGLAAGAFVHPVSEKLKPYQAQLILSFNF